MINQLISAFSVEVLPGNKIHLTFYYYDISTDSDYYFPIKVNTDKRLFFQISP